MAKSRKKRIIAGVVGGVTVGGIAYGVYSMSKRHTNSNNDSSTSTSGDTSSSSSSDEESSSSSSSSNTNTKTKKKTVTQDVPITNYKEALEFANREWNKIKRGNGRQLECTTLGSTRWKAGEWCKVYLPSFDVDGYMYIIRVSQSSDGGDWTTNLSLVDYPPGWGKEETEDKTEEEESSDDDSSEDSNTSDTETAVVGNTTN